MLRNEKRYGLMEMSGECVGQCKGGHTILGNLVRPASLSAVYAVKQHKITQKDHWS